jgi:hypothetical protein
MSAADPQDEAGARIWIKPLLNKLKAGRAPSLLNDLRMYGASPAVTHKFYLRVQTQNGEGVFRSPRTAGSNFVADFEGAVGRNYAIHSSTNLTALTTTVGTAVFTNAITGNGPRYYRAMLLP